MKIKSHNLKFYNHEPVSSLINGVAADFLNVHDRAIHYGDGVFETVLCASNKLYYWGQHFERLFLSAARLKIDCPSEQVFLEDIKRLLRENKNQGSAPFVIKIILSRGVSERGYKIDNHGSVNRIVLLSPLSSDYSSLLTASLLDGELFVCQQQASINESLAGIKHLNRLENVLARNEWQETAKFGYIDGLMLNANSHVIEGSMSNLFAVKHGKLYTPQLKQSGVEGVMRKMIIDVISSTQLSLTITNLTLEQLYEMDELFISNSLIGIKSVTKLGDCHYQKNTTCMVFEQILNTKEAYVEQV